MTKILASQTVSYTIVALDKDGNVVTSVPADSAPVWSNSADAVAGLVPSTDFGSATVTPTPANVVGGVDNVSVSISIGGQIFTATDELDVTGTAPPPPPAPASTIVKIALVATVNG